MSSLNTTTIDKNGNSYFFSGPSKIFVKTKSNYILLTNYRSNQTNFVCGKGNTCINNVGNSVSNLESNLPDLKSNFLLYDFFDFKSIVSVLILCIVIKNFDTIKINFKKRLEEVLEKNDNTSLFEKFCLFAKLELSRRMYMYPKIFSSCVLKIFIKKLFVLSFINYGYLRLEEEST